MATGLITSNKKRSGNVLGNDHHAVSDESLVAAVKRGDASAFDELHKRHTGKIFRMVHRITRNREDAEDALQECFLNAFLHLRSFDGRSRFSTWLTRIAMNSALMRLRKNRDCREVPLEGLVTTSEFRPQHRFADPSPNPEERYAKSEEASILRDAIAKLRPAIRKAVEIKLQDCSLDETAEIMGISVPALKGRLFHARAELRRGSQLHFVVPAIWTHAEPLTRQLERGRKVEHERKGLPLNPRIRIEAAIQAKGVSFEEAQL
ncbi:MAG: sigma-70 family RNA polymerase sigma factor [Candidatus Acidiferrum sp.]